MDATSATTNEHGKEEKVNQTEHHEQDDAAVRITALSSAFRRLHTVLSIDHEAQQFSLSELQAKRITTESPGLTHRDKVQNMDVYLPCSSAHYGGALPLSSYYQNECVLLRSNPIWRNQKYAIPSHLFAFNKVAHLLDERNDEVPKEEREH